MQNIVFLRASLTVLFVFVGQAKVNAQYLKVERPYQSAPTKLLKATEITVSNPHPKQGETIKVLVSTNSPEKADQIMSFSFNGKSFPLFEQQGLTEPEINRPSSLLSPNTKDEAAEQQPGTINKVGLLAIPADIQAGRYSITVEQIIKSITVLNGKFPVQRLSLPQSKDNFTMSAGEKKAIEEAKETVSSARLWKGPFIAPNKARVSAGFGLKRIVNGKLLKDYFHSGLDFAAPLGSPVHACAPGQVVLAAQGFRLHGNTICIDHGQGVVSFYIHLKKLSVNTGETVKQGQLIGAVGQTGRATGPHLHFSLYVNQIATNPIPWFKHAF